MSSTSLASFNILAKQFKMQNITEKKKASEQQTR